MSCPNLLFQWKLHKYTILTNVVLFSGTNGYLPVNVACVEGVIKARKQTSKQTNKKPVYFSLCFKKEEKVIQV